MRVFLDSCVILSRIPREIAFALAKDKLVELAYSRSVEEESMHVAMRNQIAPDIAAAFIDLRLLAEPVEGGERDDLWLPDEGDIHVLKGAIAANADVILTENLKDFPKAALAPHELVAVAPDAFYFEMLDANSQFLEGYGVKELKRAKLYRTAKLINPKTLG